MKVHTTSVRLGEQELTLETGKLAGQANAAVVARLNDNVVLATVVMGPVNENLDYFPLFVEYQEKLYSSGKIKGSRWVKREGRPSDESVLTARLIDRTIRPLFPNGFKNEVQVIVTTLSVDGENPVDMLALYAVSAALAISDIPWGGPVGGVRFGQDEAGSLVVNPTFAQLETSKLDLIVSATKDAVLMVEAGANEVSEAHILEAFKKAQEIIASTCADIAAFAKKIGRPKHQFTPETIDPTLVEKITQDAKDEIKDIVTATANLERNAEKALIDRLFETYAETYPKKHIVSVVAELVKSETRRRVLKEGIRADGRKLDEIRPITVEVGVLPRTHGSALFTRGETQALTITTLGSPAMSQLIEGAELESTKRYIHHYFMPPYTVGEVGRLGWPSRREVGHGALAERALEPMIPAETEFPYTIRVVSEILSSNGSTSMASVCGSTLSLMDAGVKIKKPVAGIAMGLITDGKTYHVLSDIKGFEDQTGDMDFKVAGTKDGITALQMDTKVKGIPQDVLVRALEQARLGRLHILDKMLAVLKDPRTSLSKYAPKITTIQVPIERIGEIIGPGGKVIKGIIAESGAQVDIDDLGNVFITAMSDEAMVKARSMVEGIIKVVQPGEEYDGKVTRLMNFGAFVEILPGKEGLVHVSRMSTSYVQDPASLVKVGDPVHVRVSEIDSQGRINLTMLTPEEEAQARERNPRPDRPRGSYDRSPRRDNRGPRRPFRR